MKKYFVKFFFLVLITISSVLFISTIEVGVKKPEGYAVGSYLANAMMPIFTIIGSVIVYYAFIAQLNASKYSCNSKNKVLKIYFSDCWTT